jgi:hypothetical protein
VAYWNATGWQQPTDIRGLSKVNTTACTKQIMGSSVEEKREEVMEVRAKSK